MIHNAELARDGFVTLNGVQGLFYGPEPLTGHNALLEKTIVLLDGTVPVGPAPVLATV